MKSQKSTSTKPPAKRNYAAINLNKVSERRERIRNLNAESAKAAPSDCPICCGCGSGRDC